MSRQFGHNNNSARQPHPHAGTPGLQPLGLQGQVGPAGVGVPIQLQGGFQPASAGNALPGATVSAVGAYGSPGSNFVSQQGPPSAASPFGISLGQQQPAFYTPASSIPTISTANGSAHPFGSLGQPGATSASSYRGNNFFQNSAPMSNSNGSFAGAASTGNLAARFAAAGPPMNAAQHWNTYLGAPPQVHPGAQQGAPVNTVTSVAASTAPARARSAG